MTRPVQSSQLDGLAAILTDLGLEFAPTGAARTALARMRDHANSHGYPTTASGTGSSGTGTSSSSATERAALGTDPTLDDYRQAIRTAHRIATDALELRRLLGRYAGTPVKACPRGCGPIPATRVRCPKCQQHPDTRVCENLSCMAVVHPGRKLLEGTDGVHRCETCHRFRKRNGRDRTADDTIPTDDPATVRASDGTVAFRWHDKGGAA